MTEIIMLLAIFLIGDLVYKRLISKRYCKPKIKVGEVYVMPRDMAKKQHFCSKCGAFLYTKPETRKVYPTDPDWSRFSRVTYKLRTPPIGYISVTVYKYRCPQCDEIKEYDEQRKIERVQSTLKKTVLTENEINTHLPHILAREQKRRKTIYIIEKIILVVIFALIAVYMLKGGKITLHL